MTNNTAQKALGSFVKIFKQAVSMTNCVNWAEFAGDKRSRKFGC